MEKLQKKMIGKRLTEFINERNVRRGSDNTLSGRLNQITISIVLVVGIFAAGAIFLQNYVKSRISIAAIHDNLIQTSSAEIAGLVPIFLLPEQRAGLDVYVREIAKRESLDLIQIIMPEELPPHEFHACKLGEVVSFCESSLAQVSIAAVIIPIRSAGHTFGYMLKARRVGSTLGSSQLLSSIEVIAFILTALLALLITAVSRVVSRQVPHALDEITDWLERALREGETSNMPVLAFKEFNDLCAKIGLIVSREQFARENAKLGELAAQVSHDIRSPLAALAMINSDLSSLPEAQRLIVRNSVQRINDIANGLLHKSRLAKMAKDSDEKAASGFQSKSRAPVMLAGLIDAVVSEKRYEFRDRLGIEIRCELTSSYGLFVDICSTEFSRTVSNVVNNAVEAISHNGSVVLKICLSADEVYLTIKDDGSGIDEETLTKIGTRGFSKGKVGEKSGFGLGTYHATSVIGSAGGRFEITSELGVGTCVHIFLPKVESPEWFVDELIIHQDAKIISVDDDQTIHQVWSERLRKTDLSRCRLQHIQFSNPEQLAAFLHEDPDVQDRYLVDYEYLDHELDGLDLIARCNIANRAILVTSRYDEVEVQTRAQKLGVQILPKSLAHLLPISIAREKRKLDAIIIDDDILLIHSMWAIAAENESKSIECFSSELEFCSRSSEFHFSSPVIIDVQLSDNVRGEDVAIRIYELGFKDIVLATGLPADLLRVPNCVKRVQGKDPQF